MRIYLDHNATAPLGPEVREAMLRFLGPPANPSSAHREGARARSALETARAQVAALVGAAPAEIVLTSGATEANNLALRGTAAGRGIVTTAIEHASVLETAQAVAAPLTVVPVDGEGRMDAARVVAACDARTRLVSVGLANGEVGSVAPVGAIAAALRGRRADERGYLRPRRLECAPGVRALAVRARGVRGRPQEGQHGLPHLGPERRRRVVVEVDAHGLRGAARARVSRGARPMPGGGGGLPGAPCRACSPCCRPGPANSPRSRCATRPPSPSARARRPTR